MGFNSIFRQQFVKQRPDCVWPGPPSAGNLRDSQPGLNETCQSGSDSSSKPDEGQQQRAGSLCCSGASRRMLWDLCLWACFTCCWQCASENGNAVRIIASCLSTLDLPKQWQVACSLLQMILSTTKSPIIYHHLNPFVFTAFSASYLRQYSKGLTGRDCGFFFSFLKEFI